MKLILIVTLGAVAMLALGVYLRVKRTRDREDPYMTTMWELMDRANSEEEYQFLKQQRRRDYERYGRRSTDGPKDDD